MVLSKRVDNRAQPLAGKAVKMLGEKLITPFVESSHARPPLARVSTEVDTYQSRAIRPVTTKVGSARSSTAVRRRWW
jgi:hypothetical protein